MYVYVYIHTFEFQSLHKVTTPGLHHDYTFLENQGKYMRSRGKKIVKEEFGIKLDEKNVLQYERLGKIYFVNYRKFFTLVWEEKKMKVRGEKSEWLEFVKKFNRCKRRREEKKVFEEVFKRKVSEKVLDELSVIQYVFHFSEKVIKKAQKEKVMFLELNEARKEGVTIDEEKRIELGQRISYLRQKVRFFELGEDDVLVKKLKKLEEMYKQGL